MLRRLPEDHKANALQLLFGTTKYDPLHELPHGDMLVRLLRLSMSRGRDYLTLTRYFYFTPGKEA